MKFTLPVLLGAALLAACVAPAVASPKPLTQSQADEDRDRWRNTQAYKDGFAQGQADARAGAARNDQPPAQWTRDDDMRAFRQGYEAGYGNIAREGARSMGSGMEQARHFGYDDGLANGRADLRAGKDFRPEHGDLYEHATHGWAPELGTRAEWQQYYREGYVRGYEEGYRGSAR